MRRLLRILVAGVATIAAGASQASADVPVRLVPEGGWRTGTVAVPAGATVVGIRVRGTAPTTIALRSTDDYVTLDQGTVVQRRNSKEPLDKGGWSFFPQNPSGADHLDPLVALGIRTGNAAWIGWPQNDRIEALRSAWIDSTTATEQRALARELQAEALQEVVYAPLGRYFQQSAWRRNISGILRAPLPLFWNVQKF